MKNKFKIYTDGACSGNPGVGGWACIFIEEKTKKTKVFSGNSENTTNNRMELLAVINAIKELTSNYIFDKAEIYSDSEYVVSAINKKWLKKWKQNNWLTTNKTKVKNIDLWEELLTLDLTNIQLIKVKGHSGNEYNEQCDKYAKAEVKKILEKRN